MISVDDERIVVIHNKFSCIDCQLIQFGDQGYIFIV
jgi:hypothetical protein